VAVLKDSPAPETATRFLDFLESPVAADIFRRHGFITRD
jgi:ABC-type molybdate transport system substrate-binding protein